MIRCPQSPHEPRVGRARAWKFVVRKHVAELGCGGSCAADHAAIYSMMHNVLSCARHSRNQSSTHVIAQPSHAHLHEPFHGLCGRPELGDCGDLIGAFVNLGMLQVASGAGWGLAGQALSTALA
jgi:hypothetical protein